MKNAEAWTHYKDYTRDVTEHSRRLGFAGAAICWAMKDADGSFSISTRIALGLFICYFIADILQSLIGALLLRSWLRGEEIKKWKESKSIDGDYQKPGWLDYPSLFLFITKIVFLLAGFVSVGATIFNKTR